MVRQHSEDKWILLRPGHAMTVGAPVTILQGFNITPHQPL
jgi:hypothetical protein